MSAELVAALTGIAATGGAAVVEAAATDTWETVKSRFSQLLGKGDPEREVLEAELLEETNRALSTSSSEERDVLVADRQAHVQTLLLQAMIADRSIVPELQALVDELRTDQQDRRPQSPRVSQKAKASHGGMVQQAGRDMIVRAHGGQPPP